MTASDKWRAIQAALKIHVDGDPGKNTADAVAAKLGISWAVNRGPVIDQESDDLLPEPPWMKESRKFIGLQEIHGSKHNPAILRWWQLIRAPFTDDETPWCAGFVGGILESLGIKSTRSAAARSYATFGKKLTRPAQGCIVTFWRGSRSGWSGHVAFLAGMTEAGDLWCVGGNQGDKVSIAKFSGERLLSFNWPDDGSDPYQFPVRRMNAGGGYSKNEA